MPGFINLAYYNKKDWSRFVEVIDDRHVMHERWEEWFEEFKRTKKLLEAEGFVVHVITVDIDELIRYCFQKGIKIDGKARSKFVVEQG